MAGSAGGLDLLAGGLREAVRVHSQLLRNLALAEDLHRDSFAGGKVLLAQRIESQLGAVVEARIEILQVDRLCVRAAVLLERHRLLHVRTAQLAHPHVDRVLAALVADLFLGARARACALLATTGSLAEAGALAAADPLLAVARAGVRLQVVQSDFFCLSHRSSPDARPSRACRVSPRCPASRRSGRSSQGRASPECRAASGSSRSSTSPA